jgi:serine/threonine-protein kinase
MIQNQLRPLPSANRVADFTTACYLNSAMANSSVTDSPSAATGAKFGRFYLQERINSGGMADIWLATDANGKACALRRMHEKYRFSFGARRRFVRGCELLAAIHDHPNIIGYIEHGKTDGALYLAMEYVEGASLKQLYASQDPVLGEHIAQILIDMACALEHVHENGFMHLDFKPENVIVTRNGSIRLIDFDIAQPLPSRPKKMSKNPGTPSYMAPEQLKQEPIDGRVDIFSYGVATYELLTNQKPFPGDSPGEILARQITRSDFVAPRQHNPDIPVAMEKVIVKCLEEDAEKRYPFFSVLVRDVKAALYV